MSFTVVLLAFVGFFLNCQPSEPFLSPYIESTRNVTHPQLIDIVYPWNTWSSLLFILPVGICAQLWGSKPIIFVGLVARQLTRILLLFSHGVLPMALAQITYGLATSINQAVWYSFVYSVVHSSSYEKGTAWVRGGYSFGNVVGCFLGQWMTSVWNESLAALFWISWMLCTVGCGLALV